jgi:hypothetical protein
VNPVCVGAGGESPSPLFCFFRGRGCPGRFRPVENLEKQAKKQAAPLHLSAQIISAEKFPKNISPPLLK